MFNTIIRFSLNNRLIILAFTAILLVAGSYRMTQLPVDVLPDLSRPRVIVIIECPGMAPEEAESLVTVPIETYLNGAIGVTSIRSNSTAGLVVLTIEFDWNMDAIRCRQIVDERLQLAMDRLPEGIVPRMIPMASMMGQVMHLTIWDEHNELSPMELRSLADSVVRPRMLSAGGVSEVLVIGGDVKQYQVLVRIDDMFRLGVTFEDIQKSLEGGNRNVTGGFLTGQGSRELLVRSIGRLEKPDDLKTLVVKGDTDPPIQLHQVADVIVGPAAKVGASGVYLKNPDGTMISRPAVVLTVEKQNGIDTRELSNRILEISNDIQKTINLTHPHVRIAPLYQQKTFINLAIANVGEALILGAILIVIVLFLFLMDLRITLITMLAIPISIVMTCLVFAWFGLSINTMTLGGLAVAIGELVDDAIVDVENIYRRLRQNFQCPHGERKPVIQVVFQASSEIRNSIVYGTIIVVIVFCPVFFLGGMEGKMFAPMGVAYIVSLFASLIVSLTVTPVLAYLLLPNKAERHKHMETFILKISKQCAEWAIRFSLTFPKTVLTGGLLATLLAAMIFFTLERDFVPPFNEGAPQVNVSLPPGTSLKTSEAFASNVAEDLLQIDGVNAVLRKTGRAELDEHAIPVNMSEMMCMLDLKSGRSIAEIFGDIEEVIAPERMPGVVAFYDQPLQHLIAHLRTGTRAKIAIKIRGDDPMLLRRRAVRIQKLISGIPDIGNPRIDPPQKDIPQVRIHLQRDELATYGLIPEDINAKIETAMQGTVATGILEGKRTIDVVLRASDSYRENLDALAQMPVQTPNGQLIPLSAVADINREASGPNRIDHEAGQTQITIQMNPQTRAAVDVKNEIDRVLAPHLRELTSSGVDLEMTGLFQSEQESSRTLVLLSIVSLVCILMVLYRMFGSVNMSLQVMSALPLALIGAVAAIVVTGQSRSIPNLIGMISLCGIASRNGILIIDHYFHLVRHEGEAFTKEMLVKAGRNRVAPVLMTTLTAMLGLLPITFSPDTPGREILYPIATVIVGGLMTSTLMEFFVRPALFWTFGRKTAERMIENEKESEDRA
ncbi:MAG: efflux RND transporter permease subunit [Planctomycetaceae bacterium]|nr:efflux RND transporter permease subunit [Planctomycetaceae bacterium]